MGRMMTADEGAWGMVYVEGDQSAVADVLLRALGGAGYEVYDAYGSAFPPAYARAVRTFVAPTSGAWTRILGEFDAALLPALASSFPVIDAQVTAGDDDHEAEASLAVWLDGVRQAELTAIADRLDAAWARDIAAGVQRLTDWRAAPQIIQPDARPTGSFVPRETLPGYARGLFDTLNPEQAGSLFNRMTSSLAGKLGKAQMESARGLLQPRRIDWTRGKPAIVAETLSALYGGQQGWRDPDFVALRDAYQLHVRRRDRPQAPLYPGDAEALAAVPDALAYVPVYGGKR